MTNATTTVADITEKSVETQTGTTTQRVADAAHSAIDQTAEKAEAVERQLREKAERAGEKVDATQEVATEKVEQSIAKVEAFVKEQPITAAGIAFAAGILTTALLRR